MLFIGPFKDFILHPKTQYFLSLYEKHVNLDFFLGEPLLPLTTSIVILFMLHKRVNNFILALAGAILFKINPIYVVISASLWLFFFNNSVPKQYKKSARVCKYILKQFFLSPQSDLYIFYFFKN
jgi:hypothetical protein